MEFGMKTFKGTTLTVAVFAFAMLVLFLIGSSTYKHNQIDPTGATKIGDNVFPIAANYYDAIARGDVDGCVAFNKFGSNADIDIAATEDVIDVGGDLVETLVATPAKVWLQSTDIDDDADLDAAPGTPGDGAREVTIYGLSTAGALQSDPVAMDGITLVQSALIFSFIYRMEVTDAGDSETNEGDINCTDNPITEIYALIQTGNGQTLMSVFKVPVNNLFVMPLYSFSVGDASPAGVTAQCAIFAKDGSNAYRIQHKRGLVQGGSQSFEHLFTLPYVFTAGTIIKLRCSVDKDNTIIDASFDGYIIDIS